MTLLTIFIFGLIVGSFLNAVIFRLHSGESVLFGRSHCPNCKHELQALDLIPILSFIFLKGRCRYCGKQISWQYPFVELITALLFLLFAYQLQTTNHNLQFWYQLTVICFLIVIAVFDFKHYLILDKVVFPALALTLVFNIFSWQFINGIWGALTVSGFFAIQYFISKGRWIGFGDVKLGLFLGSLLGLRLSLIMLFIAYILGGLAGIVLIALKLKKFSSKLPFGVFLSISAIITMLYGRVLMDWYLRVIGL